MKISARQASAFVGKPDPAARGILLYGPDRGLVCERLDRLTLTIVESSGQTIVTNPVTELITVFPGTDGGDTGDSSGDDGVPDDREPTAGDAACGAGLLVMIPVFAFMALARRRFVSRG